MSKVSVIIPARKEPFICETIKDLYANAEGEIQVILVLDGDRPEYRLPRRKGMRILHNKCYIGMRNCVNQAVEVADGKYIMKMDAHCTIGEGWDEILKAECPDNSIVVPRRYWFDAPTWTVKDKPHVDAMSYKYPFTSPYRPRLTCRPDTQRMEKQEGDIVEDMGFQGSLWFMHREHFVNRIGPMDAYGYGTFGEEPQELGLKTQLGPWEGSILRNKKTWYAHWAKPGIHWRMAPEKAGRVTDREREGAYLYAWDFWWHNRWEDRSHDFEWLIDKFWPLPRWPENWRWLTKQYNRIEIEKLWL